MSRPGVPSLLRRASPDAAPAQWVASPSGSLGSAREGFSESGRGLVFPWFCPGAGNKGAAAYSGLFCACMWLAVAQGTSYPPRVGRQG